MTSQEIEDDWEMVSPPSERRSRRRVDIRRKWGRFELTIQIGPKVRQHQDSPSRDTAHNHQEPNDSVSRTQTASALEQSLQTESPLFQIPAELRLQIYELVFRAPPDVQPGPTHTSVKPSILSLIQTCKRIHFEAEEIYYSINRLEIDIFSPYLEHLNQQRRGAITALTIHGRPGSGGSSGNAVLPTLETLHLVPNLESLWIVPKLSIRWLDRPSWTLMKPQIIAALGKVPRLRDVRIVLPSVSGELSELEAARKRKWDDFVAELQSSVSRDRGAAN